MTERQVPKLYSAEELMGARWQDRWSGKPKYRTSDCDRCGFHLEHEGEEETCEWGVTHKVLVSREEGERSCALLSPSRPSPRVERILGQREFKARGYVFQTKVLPWE